MTQPTPTPSPEAIEVSFENLAQSEDRRVSLLGNIAAPLLSAECVQDFSAAQTYCFVCLKEFAPGEAHMPISFLENNPGGPLANSIEPLPQDWSSVDIRLTDHWLNPIPVGEWVRVEGWVFIVHQGGLSGQAAIAVDLLEMIR